MTDDDPPPVPPELVPAWTLARDAASIAVEAGTAFDQDAQCYPLPLPGGWALVLTNGEVWTLRSGRAWRTRWPEFSEWDVYQDGERVGHAEVLDGPTHLN